MNTDPRGTMIQQGNIMRIDNALVEEASCTGIANGFILVSYAVPEANQSVSIQNIRLNINRNTVVLNEFGQVISVCRIREGMWVNVVFSSRMTRSIPPQASAFFIAVQSSVQPQPSAVTTGRIAFVDAENNVVYTGNPLDIHTQTRFIVTNATLITNRAGGVISIRGLRPGQMVRITHANFQTASIPPQTTAFHIQII